MAQRGQRKCLSCGAFFVPDRRNVKRQRYCSEPSCRCASKAASQAKWRSKPENRDYFSGPTHVQRVRSWRQAHPGYSRGRAPGGSALQEGSRAQVIDSIDESADRGEPSEITRAQALQDLFTPSKALLAGLIAQLCDVALQDDIATTVRRLLQRGQDLIARGACHDGSDQTRAVPRAAAAGAAAVQLG
jgi:hypothetical protein